MIAIGLFLFGLIAWAAAAVLWVAGADATDPARNYAATIALAVVGAALVIVAAIYDTDR
jgi:hypothetical protein